MISTQMRFAVLDVFNNLNTEEQPEKFDILRRYVDEVEPDFNDNITDEEVKSLMKEAMIKVLDRADELEFTDSELIVFFNN